MDYIILSLTLLAIGIIGLVTKHDLIKMLIAIEMMTAGNYGMAADWDNDAATEDTWGVGTYDEGADTYTLLYEPEAANALLGRPAARVTSTPVAITVTGEMEVGTRLDIVDEPVEVGDAIEDHTCGISVVDEDLLVGHGCLDDGDLQAQ